MSEQQSSYRQIVKTTGLFGGVEVLRILINLIQTKVVAILLGPTGVGVQNMFLTALHMLTSFFGLGLHTSAVREIAQAKATDDEHTISQSIKSLHLWVQITALIGAVFIVVFSGKLSEWTFGTRDYSLQFVILSLALVFTLISNGQIALIKGLRKLKNLAKASLWGAFISLIVSLPLFYFFKIKGIVPALVITALATLICSWIYAKRIKVTNYKISIKEAWRTGKGMLKLGFFLMLSTFLAQLCSFIINRYIAEYGTYADVGFFRAGYLITSHYVGLIFTAMAADFLPRLTEVNNDSLRMNEVVYHQSEIASLIIGPMVCFLFPLVHVIINILYSYEFAIIENYICWAGLALIIRAMVWCLSYMLLAKGFSIKYFFSELFSNVTNVIFCLIGYKLWHIEGLGIAFLFNNFACLIYNYCVARKYCGFRITPKFFKFFILINILVVAAFLIHRYIKGYVGITLSILVAACTSYYCIKILLNKLDIDIKGLLSKTKR